MATFGGGYMKDWRVWVIAGVLAFALGFCAGRGSRSISPKLRWEVDSLRATAGEYQRSRDSARFAAQRLVAQADSLDAARRQSVRNADMSAQVARDLLRKVRNLDTSLANARNTGDSLLVVVEQRDQALAAADAAMSESTSLRGALTSQIEASVLLRRRIEGDSVTLARTADRLAVAEGLVERLAKAGRGCRIPVLGIRCPVVGAGYGLTLAGGEVRHGVTLALLVPLP